MDSDACRRSRLPDVPASRVGSRSAPTLEPAPAAFVFSLPDFADWPRLLSRSARCRAGPGRRVAGRKGLELGLLEGTEGNRGIRELLLARGLPGTSGDGVNSALT